MRWADERYVRVYTRDTGDWAALGWQAQALFLLLLRKADRAGILSTGKSGVRGLAALAGMPLEIVKEAEQILLDDGCIRKMDGGYLIPNYISAQEAKSSDKARQQKARETARDLATASGVTNGDSASQDVTTSHTTSHDVTTDDAESHGVTPSLAVPSRAEPKVCPPVVGPSVADDGLPDATDDAELPEAPARPELMLTPPVAPKAARSRKPPAPKPEPKGDRRHTPLVDALCAPEHGYAFLGGQDGKAVTKLLSLADSNPRTAGDAAPAEVIRRWRICRAWKGFPQSRHLADFANNWNSYATPQSGPGAVPFPAAQSVADMPAHIIRRAETHHNTLMEIGDAEVAIPHSS